MRSWLLVLFWRLGGSLLSGKAMRAFDILSKKSWLFRPASLACHVKMAQLEQAAEKGTGMLREPVSGSFLPSVVQYTNYVDLVCLLDTWHDIVY